MDALTPLHDLHQALSHIVENNDKHFRFVEATQNTPRLWAVIDWATYLTQLDNNHAGEHVRTALASMQESRDFSNELPLPKHKFPGRGQRATVVSPSHLLIHILTRLPKKFTAVAAIIKAVNDTAARYLGGDTSMAAEVNTIRQVQQQLPSDHPMRAFGEAVETGAVGRLLDQQPVDQSKIAWHDTREDTKHTNKTLNAVIKQAKPNAKACDYAHESAVNAVVVTGETPAEFKRKRGISKHKSTRNFYTQPQLTSMKTLEMFVADVRSSANVDSEQAEKLAVIRRNMSEMCKIAGYHHQAQLSGPPKLNCAESEQLINVLANKRKSIEAQAPDTEQVVHKNKRCKVIKKTVNNRCTINQFFSGK